MSLTAQQIEKDLTDLWKDGPEAAAKGKARSLGLQRVYTTNLVVYASGHDEGYRVEQIMNDLAEKHPGRYILIRPAADPAEPDLRHYVSGHCFFGGREKKVCCDLIKLVAQKKVIENLYGFTFSLLLPDLPVEFWWPGDLPYENPFFERMAAQSNRVWVDSSKFEAPEASLARLAAFWGSRFPNTLLMDLNWIRLQRWRALIAELFDGEWAGALRSVKRISVAYGEGSSPTRGFFLACWLASRLGWSYRGKRVARFPQELTFESPSGPVEVVLKPVPVADAKRDRIFAVGLVTQGERPGTFTVMRDKDPHCVVAQSEVGGEKAFSRTVTFEHLYSNELLTLGLKHLRPDACWDGALGLAGTILERPDFTKG